MLQLRAPAFILAAVAGSVSALGPHANLPITNKHIAPDGFSRVWVFHYCCQILCLIEWHFSQRHHRRGLVPWSNNLYKQGEVQYTDNIYNPNSNPPVIQGEEFAIDVMDKLTDKSLDLGTSIVRLLLKVV